MSGKRKTTPVVSQAVLDRARRLVREDRIQQVTPDETWIVDSDSGATYAVMVWLNHNSANGRRRGAVLRTRCTCDAGKSNLPCCHALGVMAEGSRLPALTSDET